jgi:hypothetical protein
MEFPFDTCFAEFPAIAILNYTPSKSGFQAAAPHPRAFFRFYPPAWETDRPGTEGKHSRNAPDTVVTDVFFDKTAVLKNFFRFSA